ncbi:ATP-binding cassette domain-containing protein [Tumidithrix elongata RA019]|uniref:ATP-binding cassette domain-containing protein n=1 Tax=Tumidithrix elongata BACA0141 TaxID=2716417 RepID=A0AAW9Q3D0_9CYAN|nr:ATP-binding cassette domain-containing protein [Tumidithrix elongata RA019]
MEIKLQNCGQRISIVGTSGSGKTTLAKNISQLLQIPHVELDALHWEPNWIEAPDQVFRDRISKALSGDRWVVDGNYSKVRDLVWGSADTVVFLDYPFEIVLRQLLRRTLQRSLNKEELWSGNRESIYKTFFSQDSILLWMLKTYANNRKKYPALLQQPEYKHLSFVHLRSPKMTEAWLTLARCSKNLC